MFILLGFFLHFVAIGLDDFKHRIYQFTGLFSRYVPKQRFCSRKEQNCIITRFEFVASDCRHTKHRPRPARKSGRIQLRRKLNPSENDACCRGFLEKCSRGGKLRCAGFPRQNSNPTSSGSSANTASSDPVPWRKITAQVASPPIGYGA